MTQQTSAALADQLLIDAFGRVHALIPAIVEDLDTAELIWRPDPGANSIGWLLWHLSRVQDDHFADLTGREQVWVREGWVGRFALPYEDGAIGYGQSSDEVGTFAIDDPALLTSYHSVVHDATVEALHGFAPDDYEHVVDADWDPPVTLGARVVSVLADITQHAGQAAYVRGLLERRA